MSNQSGDETAILALIHRARIAVWMHDFDTYEKCFVHDADTARWNASPISGIQARQGWDPISAAARRMSMRSRAKPITPTPMTPKSSISAFA
jgi:hypothetical protein